VVKYRGMNRALVLLVALVAGVIGVPLLAPAPAGSSLVLEELYIPSRSGHEWLAVTIVRPSGGGPYGAVVLNHGTGLTERARQLESPSSFLHAAAAMAKRGYAVVMPLRRGFGATGGRFAEDAGPCANPRYQAGEREAASDVLAAYEYARKLPYVDPSRLILAGQSSGGVASLYAASQRPPGLVAVLAFGAGRGADPLHPGVPCAAERLAAVFEETGRAIEVPVLMHYAENDRSFGPAASASWFKRFTAAGARAEYVLQPPFGDDGHYLFSERSGVPLWLPEVESFLGRHRIPFKAPEQRSA
jgi:dienelactone hydrolase